MGRKSNFGKMAVLREILFARMGGLAHILATDWKERDKTPAL